MCCRAYLRGVRCSLALCREAADMVCPVQDVHVEKQLLEARHHRAAPLECARQQEELVVVGARPRDAESEQLQQLL
jgi:hypothetical protein